MISYVKLSKEEKTQWKVILEQKKNIKLSDFKVIFHCNSYFQSITLLKDEEKVIPSTLIALDKENKYHFIVVEEQVSIADWLPNLYDVVDNVYDNEKALFKVLSHEWSITKQNIEHFIKNTQYH